MREYVITSARKLRTRSARDLLMLGVRLALAGSQSLQRRERGWSTGTGRGRQHS